MRQHLLILILKNLNFKYVFIMIRVTRILLTLYSVGGIKNTVL